MNKKDLADTLVLINQNLIEEKQNEKAIKLLEKISAKHPRSAETHRLLGRAYWQIKNYEQSINNILNSLLIESDNRKIGFLLVGITAIYGTEKTIKKIEETMEIVPECIDLYRAKGFYLRRKNLYEETIANYTKGIESNPKSEKLYYLRADLFADMGRTEDAIADYEKGLEIDPNPTESYWDFFKVAVLYLKNKKFDQALKHLNSLFQISKTNMEENFSIFIWSKKEDFHKYLQICQTHLDSHPEDFAADYCHQMIAFILKTVQWDTEEQKVIEKETCP